MASSDLYMPQARIDEFLTNASSNNMVVNALATDTMFRYTCPVGKIAVITRLVFSILVIGGGVKPTTFGSGTALVSPNGCLLKSYNEDDVITHDFLGGEQILNNSNFSWIAASDVKIEVAAGVASLPVRATLAKSGGKVVLLPGHYIGFTLRDDVAVDFDTFTCMVHGHLHNLEDKATLNVTS